MKKIELFTIPAEVPESYLKDKVAVTIDVLRACTTIAHALANGAAGVVPVRGVEEATKLQASLDRGNTLLCGERNGLKIKGFDLGNSPLEYTEDVVGGKTLIMASTNGTPAVTKASAARVQLLCSFVNVGLVAEAMRASRKGVGAKSDITVICSGRDGRMALEDTVCGGMLAHILEEDGLVDMKEGANDAAVAARDLYLKYADSLPEMVRGCSHGRYLASIGFGQDLKVCSKVDSVPILPAVRDGVISSVRPGAVFETP